MKKLITDNNLLSFKDKQYIKKNILSDSLPWYHNEEAVKGDGYWFYSHILIQRIEHGGGECSPHSRFFIDLFNKFCEKNNIKYNKIFRCCLNTNFPNEFKSIAHTDHSFDYKHLLIYLNNFTKGETILLKKDKKTIDHIIKPKTNMAVSFPKCWHIGTSPKKGRRVVAVYTFK
jgi:hypothetical protein